MQDAENANISDEDKSRKIDTLKKELALVHWSHTATDKKVIASMPFHYQRLFDFVLTRKSGISQELFDRIRYNVSHGMSMSAVRTQIREVHWKEYLT